MPISIDDNLIVNVESVKGSCTIGMAIDDKLNSLALGAHANAHKVDNLPNPGAVLGLIGQDGIHMIGVSLFGEHKACHDVGNIDHSGERHKD